MPMETWEILLVDDHEIIRHGVRDVLQERFGTALSVREAGSFAAMEKALSVSLPHLLLLDLELGDGNGMELIRQLRTRFPKLRVLVFSMGAEHLFAPRAMQHGALGFISKSRPLAELVLAVKEALQGRPYVSHEEQMRRLDHKPDGGINALSEREQMVMRGLLAGQGVVEIATRSGLKPNTITTYKARLFDKLGVSNVLELQQLVRAVERE